MVSKPMDAIILAGGKGTRLRKTLGNDIPKTLAKINGIPFLDIIINHLKKFEIMKNIILAVGYKKEKIIYRYKNNKNILFSKEEKLLGTGGAIKKALSLAKSNEVLVLNGDTYLQFNPIKLLQNHIKNQAEITIGYRFEKDISRYGTLITDPKTQKVLNFNEKQNTIKSNGFISCGIYLLNKNIFDSFEIKNFSIELDFFPKAIFTKKIFGFEIISPFIDIGTASSYHRAQNILKTMR